MEALWPLRMLLQPPPVTPAPLCPGDLWVMPGLTCDSGLGNHRSASPSHMTGSEWACDSSLSHSVGDRQHCIWPLEKIILFPNGCASAAILWPWGIWRYLHESLEVLSYLRSLWELRLFLSVVWLQLHREWGLGPFALDKKILILWMKNFQIEITLS